MARESFSHNFLRVPCFLFVLFWLTYSQARLIYFFFSPPRRATNGRPFYCWCLTIFFFPFFSFCCIYQERNSLRWGQRRRKKPQHSRHPFLNCWTGDEPAHHMEAVSYWTAITSPAAKESCTSLSQPHFVFCFLDTINKLWWWWLCFFGNSFTEYRDPLLCSTRRPDSSMSGQFSIQAAASFHEI